MTSRFLASLKTQSTGWQSLPQEVDTNPWGNTSPPSPPSSPSSPSSPSPLPSRASLPFSTTPAQARVLSTRTTTPNFQSSSSTTTSNLHISHPSTQIFSPSSSTTTSTSTSAHKLIAAIESDLVAFELLLSSIETQMPAKVTTNGNNSNSSSNNNTQQYHKAVVLLEKAKAQADKLSDEMHRLDNHIYQQATQDSGKLLLDDDYFGGSALDNTATVEVSRLNHVFRSQLSRLHKMIQTLLQKQPLASQQQRAAKTTTSPNTNNNSSNTTTTTTNNNNNNNKKQSPAPSYQRGDIDVNDETPPKHTTKATTPTTTPTTTHTATRNSFDGEVQTNYGSFESAQLQQQQHQQHQQQQQWITKHHTIVTDDMLEGEQAVLLMEVERDTVELSALFNDVASLVQDQQEMFDTLEDNVESTVIRVREGSENIKKAAKTQSRIRKRTLVFVLFGAVLLLIVLLALIGPYVIPKN